MPMSSSVSRRIPKRFCKRFEKIISVKFQSFWISNQLSVQGASLELLQVIAVNPEAWDLVGGNTGEGIVVGVISTGARHTHEALSGNYRTPYGWFDAIIRRPLPYDDHSNGRGTHVLATVVGSHGVGVAPGAQWAVCKGCEDGLCRDTQIIACAEWMLCPTLPNTGSPDCSKAPNIVTCSVETTRASTLGQQQALIPIYGSGQSGSTSCKDTASPGDYENVIGVGITQRNYLDNVTESEGISYVSGRGPTADGRIKPDVTAPGQVIRSACPENDSCYRDWGTAALLLARNPDLTFDQIKNLLQDNADRNLDAADPECRGDDTTVYPNNVYGFEQNTQPILSNVNRMRFETRGHKITFMKSQLEQLAKETQQNVISVLKSQLSPVTFQSFWITNKVFVKGASSELIKAVAVFPEVKEIREEKILHIIDYHKEAIPVSIKQENLQWGVARIEADLAWNLVGGNNGEGVVVATIDTGVQYRHEALNSNFRTPYGWFDPYIRSQTPNDQDGHGTHTMGTIVGTVNGIGVAPGAQWAACKGCNEEECTEAALIRCGEWVTCPTLANTQQPDCSKAPNVVSNSWGGRQGDTFYTDVVDAWRAANIIPIFAIGNSGSSCLSVNAPGDYEIRGPTLDGRLKPEVSAPGDDIRSSCYETTTEYCNLSGTSMACPHVAGAVAILLAKNKDLTFDEIKNLLQDNADQIFPSARNLQQRQLYLLAQ
ncbi:Bacillopeptidase F [Orchesella cincta]|uniref:Bacillopeptidase F n=1 Tax=Orchesella cincta TaxID=48709 RepID=A0A1D2M2Q7_ORCCI|nr:Bacillopeptidase F [Orchesella cincta]